MNTEEMTPGQKSSAFLDRVMAGVIERSTISGQAPACRGLGCYWCCMEPVYAERTEAKEMLDSLNPADRAEVQAKTETWLAEFFGHGFNLIPSSRTHPEAHQNYSTLLRYRSARLWCPMLKNGACRNYAARPAGCRYHLAVKHPKYCEDDKKRQRQTFISFTEQYNANLYALGLLSQNAPQALFEFDHLGLWFAHFLLGETRRSRAARTVLITQTDPRDF